MNENHLSTICLKWIKCVKCRRDYFEYQKSQCDCGSYEFEEVDDTLPNLLYQINFFRARFEQLEQIITKIKEALEL